MKGYIRGIAEAIYEPGPLFRGTPPWHRRTEVRFAGKPSRILLDQFRCVGKVRLAGKMGGIDAALWHPVLMEILARERMV